ncbi:PQQ-binding-like beta-propeller repeat protein [Haloarchaeobius sp. DFWS5]|uniref:outer membrane protein assembly factor BamB family protein n=1 Tax=Haloarchaeobius sp. DFWS5 TaxID=3446114 RepID=UPI003EBA5FEF
MPPAGPSSTRPESERTSTEKSDSVRGNLSRRAVLAAAGTAAVSSLAGCSFLGSGAEPEPLYDGDWHSYGNGPANQHSVAGGTPKPTTSDTLATSSWVYASPVVHDDIVYFAEDQQVRALSLDSSEQWAHDLDREERVGVSGAVALDPNQGRLYVPTRIVPGKGRPDPAPASVTVFSLDDGSVVDTWRVGDDRSYGVAVVDGDVYARSATACVRLAPDGTEQWRASLEPLTYDEYNLDDDTATQVVPTVTDDSVYVPDRDALVKLDRETGEERWRVTVDTPYATVASSDNGVVQTGWQETVAVDHAGEVRWRRNLQSQAAAAVADGDVYVVAGDLYELDAETGETNWHVHLPSDGTAAPVVTDDTVLTVSGDVRAFPRDANGDLGTDGARWQFSDVHASTYSSPVVAAGRVFVVGAYGLQTLWAEESS